MRKTWVKVCGVTRVEDALAAVDAGVNALGVNFVETSRRRCTTDEAARIVAAVPTGVTVFGVFANAARRRVAEILAETAIGGLQFHGGEPPEELIGWPVPVLRAVAVIDASAAEKALRESGRWRVLLDSARGGGSGQRFDDTFVESLDLSTAIVAGGLSAATVAEVVRRLEPGGVDVAGGVERDGPGVKDPELIREFVLNARSS
jgi:phosphoribosylanthranilate isomerase